MEFITSPTGILLVGVLAFAVGTLLFKMDNRIEGRRKEAAELAGKLSTMGFTELPKLLRDYSVGDYSGFLSGIVRLKDELTDPDKRHAEFEKVFRIMLTERMKDPERRSLVLKLVDDVRAAHDPAYQRPETATAK